MPPVSLPNREGMAGERGLREGAAEVLRAGVFPMPGGNEGCGARGEPCAFPPLFCAEAVRRQFQGLRCVPSNCFAFSPGCYHRPFGH